ncbi:50S ribosomal protein L30 [Candidatus Bathyarchaeota archaeon]|nr:50S ribosomal protein L30 [Candidatus Bathyarchaeota archaeon]
MAGKSKKCKCIVAVRIRGTIRASQKVRATLEMLNLTRNNQAVLVDNRPSFLGMLKTAQNFVTYGEASKETVETLINKRGRREGNKKLSEDYAKNVGCKSLEGLVEAIFSCELEYWKLPHVKPVFRLHPPTKGFKGKVKKSYGMGGELGYRGEKINELVDRMA